MLLSWAWLPVKTLTMNALTLAAAFGVLVVIFQDGRLEALLDYTGSGALEAATMTIVAAIAFALATDYGVFLLTRIKEFRDHGLTQPEAIAPTSPGHIVHAAPADARRGHDPDTLAV